jgi:UDP-N-acetylglucosamine 2-epimerase (non-hydrolysing)
MIDSLRRYERKARSRRVWEELGLPEREYVLITLHRPANVDDPARFNAIVDELARLGRRHPAVFPIHPRTRAALESIGRLAELEEAGVRCAPPLGYLDFLSLETAAGAILTDSGGVQEEASALGVRCYTFRPNTERPVTISQGTNTLLGDDPAAIREIEVSSQSPTPCAIQLWDGHAAERVAATIVSALAAGRARATG